MCSTFAGLAAQQPASVCSHLSLITGSLDSAHHVLWPTFYASVSAVHLYASHKHRRDMPPPVRATDLLTGSDRPLPGGAFIPIHQSRLISSVHAADMQLLRGTVFV
jgi:hypothetical protein